MGTVYISLWFEAPLQSWGSDSKFGRRDTLPFPTKSGVYGMYLAALGASGPQRELLGQLSQQTLTVHSYSKNIGFGFDGAATPFLMDFHMVGSGYRDDKDYPWERLLIPKTAHGKASVGGGSKMTYRYYLQDAIFGLIQECDENLGHQIFSALQNPVFDVYLGRKNCVPTDFIVRGIHDSKVEAAAELERIASEKSLVLNFKVEEGDHGDESLVLSDVPRQFGQMKNI
jgi:CRISPR system Cascade subunit CasD